MNATGFKQTPGYKLASFALAAGCTLLAMGLGSTMQGLAQAPPSASPRQSGTVKAATDHDFVLTDGGGQDHAVTLPSGARVLIVPPGSKDLSAATAGSVTDLQPGDRVVVTGKAGEPGPAITAVRVLVMKSSAIAQSHAADEAAWAAGTGGIVKSIDTSANSMVVTNAARTTMISTTPQTVFRRYSGGSVRFEDATHSTFSAIGPGDQVRARGTKSVDTGTLAADEIVTGSFRNYSGELSSVDPAANTVTLKDLATKKPVTVALSAQSNLRRLPPEIAARFAARERAGAAAGGAQATRPAAAPGSAGSGTAPTSPSGSDGQRRPGTAGSYSAGQGGPGSTGGMGGGARGGGDLSAMISRLPIETLGGLKVGEAVMIVASSAEGANGRPTAVTLLAGVEPILAAAPAGEGMTLSPWNMGGGGEAEGAAPQ